MEAISAWTDRRLGEFADLALRLVRRIDAFDQQMIDALENEGWNSGQTFALRAELTRAVECADRARRYASTTRTQPSQPR
jgi:hypothetical protein